MGHPIVIAAFLVGFLIIGGLLYYAYTVYERDLNTLPTPPTPTTNNSPYIDISYRQTCDLSCQDFGHNESADFNITLTNHGYTAVRMWGSVEAFHITISGNTYFLPSNDSPDCIATRANFTISNFQVELPHGAEYSLSFTGYSASANCSTILDHSGNDLNIHWNQLT